VEAEGNRSRRERELEALHEVAVAASGMLDPAALARLVVQHARDLLGGSEATLLWWDPAANGLRVLGDTFVRPFTRVLGIGEGTAGIAFETGEPVMVDDYPTWEHAVKDSIPRGLKSVVAYPLLVTQRPVGALTVSFNVEHRFTPDDLRLLSLFAVQVAPAIEAARLHDQLVHVSEQLKSASEAKSRFLASMSHELRTPLNAIIGFSELLIDEPPAGYDTARRQQFLQQIHNGGKHLLELINDILDLAKVEAGQLELNLTKLPLEDAVANVIASVRPLAVRKSINLEGDVPNDVLLHADAGKTRQILLNLLSNAIKFTPDGGRVRVTATAHHDHAVITVEDTGIGISKDDIGKLFTEFQQVGDPNERAQEGTGLGLALVKKLAELHGGSVWVESELGTGSRFHVALPLAAPLTSQAARSAPLVMVVEDNEGAAMLLSTFLTRAGFAVEVVGEGRTALERAAKLRPSAITLDVMLPDVDGWEVLRRLKDAPETRDIPVQVISVMDDRALGLALGADDYLVKPVRREALIGFMRRHGLRPQGVGRERVKVLAVDDDEASLELIKENLEPEFAVAALNVGAEALAVARRDQPDFVILDLMMPGMNGFEVAAALRADPLTRHIPILVSTGKDLGPEEKARLSGNVTAVMKKSGELDGLVAWLHQTLPQEPKSGVVN
jgi:signal transduction histidine kinase/DNA-binding response OmpR family regulator